MEQFRHRVTYWSRELEPVVVGRYVSQDGTEEQVKEIMRLLRRDDGNQGGYFMGPRDRAGVRNLSQDEAATYLNSLWEVVGEW